MGIYAFKLPDIGEGVVEGEVVEWMVSCLLYTSPSPRDRG